MFVQDLLGQLPRFPGEFHRFLQVFRGDGLVGLLDECLSLGHLLPDALGELEHASAGFHNCLHPIRINSLALLLALKTLLKRELKILDLHCLRRFLKKGFSIGNVGVYLLGHLDELSDLFELLFGILPVLGGFLCLFFQLFLQLDLPKIAHSFNSNSAISLSTTLLLAGLYLSY